MPELRLGSGWMANLGDGEESKTGGGAGFEALHLSCYKLPSEVNMKPGIHPEYKAATITCACGHVAETRSTAKSLHVDICSQCHPFFTGKQKLIDSAGRVERFKRKYGMKN